MSNDINKSSHRSNGQNIKRDEKTLGEIFQIINKRKILLFISVICTLILVFIYNNIATPVYESSTLLKKEKSDKNQMRSDFQSFVNLQSPDEIETEMELVKTWSVMSKVVDELNLFLKVDKIVSPSGKETEINKSLIDYNHDFLENSAISNKLPEFVESKLEPSDNDYKFYVEKGENNIFNIYDAKTDSLLQVSKDSSAAVFKFPKLDLVMYWPSSSTGSRVYFDINSYYDTIDKLKKSITVDNKPKTDVFEISVKSSSPLGVKSNCKYNY